MSDLVSTHTDSLYLWFARYDHTNADRSLPWRLIGAEPTMNDLYLEMVSVDAAPDGLVFFIGAWLPVLGVVVTDDEDAEEIPEDLLKLLTSSLDEGKCREQVNEAVRAFYCGRLNNWGGVSNAQAMIEEIHSYGK